LLEEKDRSAMEQALNSGTSDLPEVGLGVGAQGNSTGLKWKMPLKMPRVHESSVLKAKWCWNQSQEKGRNGGLTCDKTIQSEDHWDFTSQLMGCQHVSTIKCKEFTNHGFYGSWDVGWV